MTAANKSWAETDTLYVSVCSALVTLATIFGRTDSELVRTLLPVGSLVMLLSINWMLLIKVFRRKILAALEGLANEYSRPEWGGYFEKERQEFVEDKEKDYAIAVLMFVSGLVLVLMILGPAICHLCAT
jgi:hypothetical protein